MADGLLTSADREEAISRAYVQAIAAGAGYVIASMDFDRDGIDLEIKAGGAMRPAIGVQLKATINLGEAAAEGFRFPLKKGNYEKLRIPTQVPRILVVLSLPHSEVEWLTVSEQELVVRNCAFWVSIAGAPENDNSDSVTISVPKGNFFNIEGLRALMHQSRTGLIK